MRVSTIQQLQIGLSTANRRRSELARIQEQIATGRRVTSLADDPVASRRILRDETTIRSIASSRRTASEARRLLEHSDATLASVNDLLQRAYELTLQQASDTSNTADRLNAATEVRQIREQVVELANTQQTGRYLFAGLSNRADPFAADGSFAGDTERLRVEVGRSIRVDATLGGGEGFLDPSGGPNSIQLLVDLETALANDDRAAIGDLVDPLLAAGERAVAARQQVGQRLQRLDTLTDVLDRVEIQTTAVLSAERDVDVSEAVLRLRTAETGLQAALAITGRLEGLTLLNFVG